MKKWEMAKVLLKAGDTSVFECEKNYHKQLFITVLWRGLQILGIAIGVLTVVVMIWGGVLFCECGKYLIGVLLFITAVMAGILYSIIALALHERAKQEEGDLNYRRDVYRKSI